MIVLQIIIGVIAAVGVGLLLADFMKIPSLKASKAANSVGRKGKKKTGVIELYRRDFAILTLPLRCLFLFLYWSSPFLCGRQSP